MDYRELLKKYIGHVGGFQDLAYIDAVEAFDFTEEEIEELDSLRRESDRDSEAQRAADLEVMRRVFPSFGRSEDERVG